MLRPLLRHHLIAMPQVNAPALDYDTKRRNFDRRIAELVAEFNLPPRPARKRNRGAPTHQYIWLEGLYLMLEDVGMGKARA